MSSSYNIREIDIDKDRLGFRQLFKITFGYEMTDKLWKWKYLENPMMTDQPLICVAEQKGVIVGVLAHLQNRMRFKDKILKAAQPVDAMVHPDHRKQGLFKKMTLFATKDAIRRGYSLFYNFPNEIAGKIYSTKTELGWKVLSRIDPSYKIFSPRKIISSNISEHVPAKGLIGSILSKFSKSGFPSLKPTGSYDIAEEDRVTKEFDELSEKTNATYGKISTIRDEKYLVWRFVKHPENKYNFFTARIKSELVGYFVTKIDEQQTTMGGARRISIGDYMIKDYDEDVFLALLLHVLDVSKEAGCDIVSTWAFTQPRFQKVVNRCGFIRKHSFPYSILIRRVEQEGLLVANRLVPFCLPINPFDEKNWYITQADIDTY